MFSFIDAGNLETNEGNVKGQRSLLLLLLARCSLLAHRGGGVSVVDDVLGVWSRRTEVLVRKNLLEDGLSLETSRRTRVSICRCLNRCTASRGGAYLSDGALVTQTCIWTRTQEHVARQQVTLLQRRAVGHVEVQTPEDERTAV